MSQNLLTEYLVINFYTVVNKENNQSLLIGNQKVPLLFYPHANKNYSEIIQVDKDGTAWIKNSISFSGYERITYVWKINKLGKIVALYRLTSNTKDYGTIWPVEHNIIVSNDGMVYWMTSNRQQLQFRQLKAFSLKKMQNLAKVLDPGLLLKKQTTPKSSEEKSTKLTLDELTTGRCQTRDQIVSNALDYVQNKVYISSSSIKNDTTCPQRVTPPYLIENKEKEGTYQSVSYNWGALKPLLNLIKKC